MSLKNAQNIKMEKTQPQLVVEYALQNDGFITETEAKNHFGIADLSGVIWQIKTKMSKFNVETAHLVRKNKSTFDSKEKAFEDIKL